MTRNTFEMLSTSLLWNAQLQNTIHVILSTLPVHVILATKMGLLAEKYSLALPHPLYCAERLFCFTLYLGLFRKYFYLLYILLSMHFSNKDQV